MTIEFMNFPVPDGGFERIVEIKCCEPLRKLFRKYFEFQKNAGQPLSSSREVSVA